MMRWNCKFCRYCEYLFAIGNRSPCYGCKNGSNFELSKIYDVKPAQSKPMTNGDCLRSIGDEMFAVWLGGVLDCGVCPVRSDCANGLNCVETLNNWLKQPRRTEYEP